MSITSNPAQPRLKRYLYRVPGANQAYRCLSHLTFKGSSSYWKERYQNGGNSGAGSYGPLAEFKAEVLNQFVRDQKISSIVEFGCGDGHQLTLADYEKYTGLDISSVALSQCIERFHDDPSKNFYLFDPKCCQDNQGLYRADLSMSIDVIYHLVEDEVFEAYMKHLFAAAKRYVLIYSSNDDQLPSAAHVRHRHVTGWIDSNIHGFKFLKSISNRYPHDPLRPNETSFANFYLFERTPSDSSIEGGRHS